MLPLEHSAILLTCINRKLVMKTNFGLHFEWPLKTDFTVVAKLDKWTVDNTLLFNQYLYNDFLLNEMLLC